MNGLRRLLPVFLVILVAACTHPSALKASKQNQARISGVALNQTTDQVTKIMGKAPESISQRVLDNGTHEVVWYYLTDYDAETNAAITFHNGKVVGITQSRWLGNGVFEPTGK
jgi:hypothetical protein